MPDNLPRLTISQKESTRWQISSGPNQGRPIFSFDLNLPNDLISEVLKRRGIAATQQEQMYEKDVGSLDSRSFGVWHDIKTAIDTYLAETFSSSSATNKQSYPLFDRSRWNDRKTFAEALQMQGALGITIIDSDSDHGVADHAMWVFQNEGMKIENQAGATATAKQPTNRTLPQTCVELEQGINDAVYKALGLTGAKVSPRPPFESKR